ncbi:hypothetical protein PI125_g22504 [Phytophthora idaei]|nr:hypothetical protein PI125_g22504 [Phytophthora idaei]
MKFIKTDNLLLPRQVFADRRPVLTFCSKHVVLLTERPNEPQVLPKSIKRRKQLLDEILSYLEEHNRIVAAKTKEEKEKNESPRKCWQGDAHGGATTHAETESQRRDERGWRKNPDKQTKRFKAAVLHMTPEEAAVGRVLKERKWEMERVEREEERELRLEQARMEHDRLKRIIQALVGSRGDQRNGDDAVNRDNATA